MTQSEWVARCAARLASLTGMSTTLARAAAESLAHDQHHLNGTSASSWARPEDAAEEHADE